MLPAAVARGYMTLSELIAVANWKWSGGRTAQLCEKNFQNAVKEVTQASFNASDDRLRIGALLSLHGVSWPMASTILHFAFPNRYPIFDVRVMRSVGGPRMYGFNLWEKYIELCREASGRLDLSIRELDKALWQMDVDARD